MAIMDGHNVNVRIWKTILSKVFDIVDIGFGTVEFRNELSRVFSQTTALLTSILIVLNTST